MATFAQDAFTGSTGTAITAHSSVSCTPHTDGMSWSAVGATAVLAAGGRVRATAGTDHVALTSVAPAGFEYSVEAEATVHSTSAGLSGVVARHQGAGTGTYYSLWVDLEVGTERYQIARSTAGVVTSMGTSAFTVTAGSTHLLKLDITGSTLATLNGYVGGVLVIGPLTSSHISSAGSAGVYLKRGADGANIHLDNFIAIDSAGAVAAPRPFRTLLGVGY